MDMSVFKDDDGQAYVLYATNVKPESGLWIDKLSSDYLSILSNVSCPSPHKREAPCMMKKDGVYYLCYSQCTGWWPNQSYFTTATSLGGPWAPERVFGDSTTFDSQGAWILPVVGKSGTVFIYVGDRWNFTGNAAAHDFRMSFDVSEYVLLPVEANGGEMSVEYYDRWLLDIESGSWSPGRN